MTQKYVIIGFGVSGVYAADAIHHRDPEGSITIINGEPFPAYFRAALSFYLKGSITEDELFIKPSGWAKSIGARIISDGAKTLDTKTKEIHTESGLTIPYDKLLIATGAEPFVAPWPGADKEGVVTYRTLVCVNRQLDYIKKHEAKKAIVIGGGILGAEMADNYRALGLDVTMLVLDERLLKLLFDEEAAKIIESAMEKHGIKIMAKTEMAEVLGDERVEQIRLKNGETLPADLVGVAIGVRPKADFLDGTGVAFDRGVIVNNHLETSEEGVYSAGDVAVIRDGAKVSVCRTWLTAAKMGEVAGGNMAGGKEEFFEIFYNASHVYDKYYAVVGDFSVPEGGGVSHTMIDTPDGEYAKLIVDDGVVVGGQFIGNIKPAWQIYNALMKGHRISADGVSFSGGQLANGLPQLVYGMF